MSTQYRAVIKFLTKEGLTLKIIKEILDGVYGQGSPSYSVLKKWAKRFRMGQEFLEDDKSPGRPVEVITEDKEALVEELVLSDRRLKSYHQVAIDIKTISLFSFNEC
nr:unnamed protein product [Callosobruchus analis]